MTRTITTAAELDALPVGSVVLDHTGDVHQKFPANTTDPERWASILDESRSGADMVAEVAGTFTVLHDLSAPAPAPSVVPEAAVEAGVEALAKHDPWRPDDETGWDCDCGGTFRDRRGAREHQARAALAAALPILTAAPSATRDEVARALEGEFGCFLARDPHRPDAFWGGAADALLASFTIAPKEGR